jgi:hypothetical protein
MRSIRRVTARPPGSPAMVLRLAAIVVLIGVTAGLVAGCGDSSGDSGVARADDSGVATTATTGATDAAATSGDAEQAQLDFAKCMRDQGLDFPDPKPDANGNLQFQPPAGNPDQARLQKGLTACQDLLQGAGNVLPDTNSTEFQDAQLAFAKCMRGEGVDFPDPEPGRGPGGGVRIDRNDPATAAAIEKCQPLIQSVLPGQGGGR